MTSTSLQPQFRNTQTPSKVLHLRNLPWECSEEELTELCKPFGKIVNTKCNVGANQNQAFVEFMDSNHAISMVSYFASSSEPAQIQGKTVYIQYSNRQEIINNKGSGDVAGNVLLVTIEGVEAGDVGIDVIHLVFSAFGFVQKIATFEKAAGFQALIQFTDAETASSARNALDGRSIPRYLLPEHVSSCHLRISYSAHTDLNIKFQSHRSRDYTNPYLPVNPSAIEGTMQLVLGPDGKRKEPESNVLLASIENMQYAVTVDVLHTVFSAFGTVQKIAIFEKNSGESTGFSPVQMLQQRLCQKRLWKDTASMMVAIAHNGRDYTIPETGVLQLQQSPGVQSPQPPPGYVGKEYSFASRVAVSDGQMPQWDPAFQVPRPPFPPAANMYSGQPFHPSPVGASPSSGPLPGLPAKPVPGYLNNNPYGIPPERILQQVPPYGYQLNAGSVAAPHPGQAPSYYGYK